MASIEGIINYIDTGQAVSTRWQLAATKNCSASFKYRLVRSLRVFVVFTSTTCVSPVFMAYRSFSMLINQCHDNISKEIAKHNKKIISENNNDDKNYNALCANILKVILIQLLEFPVYILYGIFFAYCDLIHYVLNHITKEKNYYILEKDRFVV